MDRELWKQLEPFTRDRVLAGYRIFAGLVVVDCSLAPSFSFTHTTKHPDYSS